MELSKEQKFLIELFQSLSMEEDLIVPTMLAVKEPEQTEKLIDYILEMWENTHHLDKDKIAMKALEISQE